MNQRKPTFLQRVKNVGLALKGAIWTSGDWVSGDSPGNISSSGSNVALRDIDFSYSAGLSYMCPAFQAGINFLIRNVPQSQVILQVESPEGIWIRRTKSSTTTVRLVNGGDALTEALKLLQRPNKFYSWKQLIAAITFSLTDNGPGGGNGYVGVTWNIAHSRPVELRWLPHDRMVAVKQPPNENETIPETSGDLVDYYEYRINGKVQRLEVDQVLHFRFGLAPYDPKYGMNSTGSLAPGIYTLKRASRFTAHLVKNGGAVDLGFWPSEPDGELDPVAFTEEFQSAHGGENVARVFAYSIPLHAEKLNSTPQELALDTLPDRAESDVAATMGVPSQVTGLHSSRNSRTHANQREAREQVAEDTIVPLLELICETFTTQYLPMFGVDDTSIRVYVDLLNNSALSPEQDRIHQRWREDYRSQMCDRYTAKVNCGIPATDADRDVYYTGFTNASDGRGQTGGSPEANMTAEESSSTRTGKGLAILNGNGVTH